MENVEATSQGVQTIEKAAVDKLRANFAGAILFPGDAGYDPARMVWNLMVDKRPSLIARCTSTGDVVAAVNFARANNLLVSVRGGGHSVAGYAICDNGLMIDLSPMKGIKVDPAQRIAL